MIDALSGTRPAIVLLVVMLVSCGAEEGGVGDMARGTLRIEAGSGTVVVDVAIAETTEERTRGLMHVRRLGEDEGMVFLHDVPTRTGFIMRNTLIPLSLAVWGSDGRIASILDMEPCRAEPCPGYDPGVEWVGAVEVNQGFFDERGVAVGDRISLER